MTNTLEPNMNRRKFLALTGATATGVSGCLGDNGGPSITDYIDNPYGSQDRPEPGGTSMDDMPDLTGELTLYLGRGEGGLYQDLIDFIRELYPDFTLTVNQDRSASLANTIIEESRAGESPADVFWSIDAGSLGAVADAGYTSRLPEDVLTMVGDEFRDSDGNWIGTSGRARAIPYNTDRFSSEDIPDNVMEFPKTEAFQNSFGWAPSYGAFQAFITAMRLLEGDERTREWLNAMQQINVTSYPDEFILSNSVADGEVGAGFANHYYALRVQNARPDAPLALAFTRNDAGALVNVAGAEVISSTESPETASNFIRHLLSSEAQEFFATVSFAYPLIPGVEPVGDIPPIDELNPPDLDLSRLSKLQPTLELMREAGLRV